jgi:hypothetical protein
MESFLGVGCLDSKNLLPFSLPFFVTVKLIFTAEVAESAERRKTISLKPLRPPRSLRLNQYVLICS